jgi:hypothetical protein
MDTELEKIVNRKSFCKQKNFFNYSLFDECVKKYFEYFMNLSNEELEELLYIVPVGSLIFHGCTAFSNISDINKKKIFLHYIPWLIT